MTEKIRNYKSFIISSIHNEAIQLFRQSKFGLNWVILQPLFQVALYALVLSNVLSNKISANTGQYDYPLYLISGILCWTLFAEILQRSVVMFLERSYLIKKSNFPLMCIPLIVVGVAVFNNIMLLAATLVVCLCIGQGLTFAVLSVVPIMLTLILFSAAVGLFAGVINVFIRDVQPMIAVILQVLFWGTPIVYPYSILPDICKILIKFNPLYYFVELYHQVILYQTFPDVSVLASLMMISFALLFCSVFIFKQAKNELVDVL